MQNSSQCKLINANQYFPHAKKKTAPPIYIQNPESWCSFPSPNKLAYWISLDKSQDVLINPPKFLKTIEAGFTIIIKNT